MDVGFAIVPERIHQKPEILARIAKGECIVDLETVLVRRNGQHFLLSMTISPLRDADNTVVGIVSEP